MSNSQKYLVHKFSSSTWRAILKRATRKMLLNLSKSIACRMITCNFGALCQPSRR